MDFGAGVGGVGLDGVVFLVGEGWAGRIFAQFLQQGFEDYFVTEISYAVVAAEGYFVLFFVHFFTVRCLFLLVYAVSGGCKRG